MVFAVLEPAPGEKDGEVRVIMSVCVAHVTSKQDGGAVEKPGIPISGLGEGFDGVFEHPHLREVGLFELRDFFGGLSVMAEPVVSFSGDALTVELEGRCCEGVEHQGDDAG